MSSYPTIVLLFEHKIMAVRESVKEVEGVECLSFYIEVNKKLKLKNS